MSLGEHFKNKRLELGKSLEQISALTKIHIKILSAIEENHYSELPARAFTRGFIISYARALGLNGNHILSEYHDFLEEKYSERQSRDLGHQGYVFEGKELEQNKRWLIFGASAAALFAVVVLLVFKPQNHKRKEKHKEFIEEPSLNPEETTESEPSLSPKPIPSQAPETTLAESKTLPLPTPFPFPSPVALASPSPSPMTDPLLKGDDLKSDEIKRKITLQANDDAWVQYQIDEKTQMAFTLRKGKFLVIKAKQSINFETTNPSALLYKTKANPYQPLPLDRFTLEADGSLKATPSH